jgi:hypothetical protein
LKDILGFPRTFDLQNEILNKHQLRRVGLTQVLLAKISRLRLAIFCSDAHLDGEYLLHGSVYKGWEYEGDLVQCQKTLIVRWRFRE